MNPTRIIIVDDHKIIRDGLIAILKDNPSIIVAGDVASGDELLDFLKVEHVDLVLLDMHMPLKSGIEVTREMKVLFPDVKILINTMSELPEEIEKAVAAGVDGYLLKTSGSEELLRAINMISHGSSYYGAAVINTFIKNLNKPIPKEKSLTPAEIKIVSLIYAEKKHPEIMEELNISKGTLNNHIQNMFRKLKIKTEIGLVKYALQEKLIG